MKCFDCQVLGHFREVAKRQSGCAEKYFQGSKCGCKNFGTKNEFSLLILKNFDVHINIGNPMNAQNIFFIFINTENK